MSVYVFVGPTLPPAEVAAALDAVSLPPVAQGDVYRLVGARPQAIGIIDGYFDGMPAVWHKEILWAMGAGVHVFGSASMGALRAAELHAFGMRGVGGIFEAFRDGTLEDDDEVAVLHGPAETGFVNLSESMVNIRATLRQAVAERCIDAATQEALVALAKRLFYQERTWENLFGNAAKELPGAGLGALRAWLPTGRVDQKGNDARAMLAGMRDFLARKPGRMRADYRFEWTDAWDAMATGGGPAEASTPLEMADLIEELRLDDKAFEAVRGPADLRFLTLRDAERRRLDPGEEARRAAADRIRARFGLYRRTDLDRWCRENDLDAATFARLVDDEARLETERAAAARQPLHQLLDQLRLDGRYAGLAERARRKREVLSGNGMLDPAPDDAGLSPPQLLSWYFETRLGRSLPDDVDAHLRVRGFADRQDFYRALLREWLYCRWERVGADR
ncbi:MAG TPA: TfuA-like protein [Methylomirabilota bacterium]|nr:TfuA-like protein [Methylomirabilota bacterium]